MPTYMLHNDLQNSWGGRQLVFYQVRFSVTYETERLIPPIRSHLRKREILSYAIYEILGEYDLFIRCWVPQGMHPEDLAEELVVAPELGIGDCRSISVSKIIFHWPWMSADYLTYERPNASKLRKDETFKIRLNNTLSEQPEGLTDDEIDEAIDKSILAPIGPELVEHREDIKFAMLLSNPDRADFKEKHLVRVALTEAFRGLVADANHAPLISHLSLYETRGSAEASFVALGRFSSGRFYDSFQSLLSTLAKTGFRSYFEIKPHTYIMASSDFVHFEDAIPIELSEARSARQGDSDDLHRLLERDESASLEYKGSFYFDIRQWLLNDLNEANEELFVSGIAREVVSFLNSPPGGVLVIGALERDRMLSKVPVVSRDKAKDLLADFPLIHGKSLTGLELDERVKSFFEDRDKAERHILDRLEKLIERPSSLAGIVLVAFHEISGRTLCTISVNPLSGKHFAYLKKDGTLYHRRGSSTIGLVGGNADDYRDRRYGFDNPDDE